MDTEQLIREIEALPDDDRQQVADFIAFLRRARQEGPIWLTDDPPIPEDPAIGMWKDRDDMKDGASWVRQLRQNEWSRRASRPRSH